MLPSATAPEAAGLDIVALLLGAARRWRLAVSIFLGVLALAATLFHFMPARYGSTVEIQMFDPQRPPDIAAKGGDMARDFDTVAMNTQIKVFESLALAERVIKNLNLDDVPEFRRAPLLVRIRAQMEYAVQRYVVCPVLGFMRADQQSACMPRTAGGALSEGQVQNDTITALMSHFSVKQVPLTYVLSVSAWSESPKLAQKLAETIVNDYLADQNDVRKKVLTEQSIWLKERIDELKARITANDEAVSALSAANSIQDTGSEALLERQIAQLNEQVTTARADVADKKARLDQARQSLALGQDLALGANDGPSALALNQLQSQRTLMTQQLATLREKLGDGHVRVVTLQAQLTELNKAIEDQSQRAVADLQAGYDIALRRQQSLSQDMQRLTSQRTNSAAYIKVQELSRAQAVDRKQYDAFLARYNEIEATRSADLSDKRIISPASVPVSPYFPSAKIFLGVGGMLGLLMGVGAALGLEFVKSNDVFGTQVSRLQGYPVIASVPPLDVKRLAAESREQTALGSAQADSAVTAARAMRDIRIAMRMPSLERMPLNVMLTSASGDAGVSTLSTLFAASCVAAGQRAIVVKCEFFRPGETDCESGVGLADILSGNADVLTAITTDSTHGFDVLSMGAATARTDDLLASKRMAELLRALRTRYDYVVIDTPPIDAGAGVAALAGMVDKILVVVDRSQLRAKSTRTALAALVPYRRRIVGVLLNRSNVLVQPQFNTDQHGGMTVEFRNDPVWPPLTVVTSERYTDAKDERA